MEFVLLFLSLSSMLLFFILFKNRSSNVKRLPPGSFGLPIIGETLQFLFGNPENFVFHRMKKHNPNIFKTKILGEKTAVICGPQGHKFLFSNEHKLFTSYRPRPMQKLFRFHKSQSSPPSITRETESKLLRSPGFLKPEALVRYLSKMDSTAQQQLQTHWEGKDVVEAFPLAKTLTLTLACRFFLGTDQPERIARLVRNFDDITLGLHCVDLNFPGTMFNKACKAAISIRKELRAIIEEKKAKMAAESTTTMQDILSHMIVVTNSFGKNMPEVEIADKIMGLIVAGYSTVATVVTFFMKYVGERPDVYEKVLAEQRMIAEAKRPGEWLEWDDIQKMKYSWNVIYEVMRLTPPLQGTFREALADFSYDGYTIPKGWKIYWTVSTTNKNPEYFPDPEKFDPSRHEGNGFPPFAFVPFGGGPRLCPGKEYARLAILTFVHNIVKRFKWKVIFPNEKIIGNMMPSPEKGLPLRLYCH